MKIDVIKVGYLRTNCYILTKNNKCLIIDPGDDYSKICSAIQNNELVGILITHAHPDHVGALEYFDAGLVYDYYNLEEGINNISCFSFEVLKTPGHKSDSLSFYFEEEKAFFSGDFIFFETIGRTDLYTSSMKEMKESLAKTNKYSDNVLIYPGHGKSTTFSYERENNPYLIKALKESLQ